MHWVAGATDWHPRQPCDCPIGEDHNAGAWRCPQCIEEAPGLTEWLAARLAQLT